jgi:hypothetical protein
LPAQAAFTLLGRHSWAEWVDVCTEEDLRDAMEKVTKYNEAESQKVVAM